MKLLFDHHLSPTLVTRLADLFPESQHVWNVGLHDVPDKTVWLYARANDFTVVSKDADFPEISIELGYPPKLVWLQIDNVSTDEVEELLRQESPKIIALPGAIDRAILVVYKRKSGLTSR